MKLVALLLCILSDGDIAISTFSIKGWLNPHLYFLHVYAFDCYRCIKLYFEHNSGEAEKSFLGIAHSQRAHN